VVPFPGEILVPPTTTTAPTERPLRADARRNHEKILQSAREVFAADGIDAQMDDVARRAGLGVGTLYRHFPTKEALLVELLRAKARAFAANTRQALESDAPPGDALRAVLMANAELMAADAVTRQVLAGAGRQLWANLGADRDELEALTADLIGRARAAGAVRSDLTSADIGMVMCGLCSSMTSNAPGFDWRRHLELLLAGLQAEPASARF
jgi:AcrR family transcriptional regulator